MPRAEYLKNRPAQLVIVAGLLLSACAPTAHTDAVIGGGSETMLRVGDAARDAGDISAAIPIYRRAHALAPLEPAPLLRLAETLHSVGAYREAGNAWDRILRIDADDFDARVGYGETLAALGQPILALEQFQLAAEIDANTRMFNGIGVSNDMLGNPVAAQAAYRSGLELEQTAKLLNNLGLSLALSGDTAQAIATLEEADRFSEAGARQRANLALAYTASGNTSRAAEILSRDMDDVSMMRTISFYETITALPDHASKVAAMGAHSTP
jgi:Flp pilus assembly protein TadD